ncbi:leucine-rich single-pass membrane protein 2 isoform X1 [Patagioenas fasciata]|uniref:leucine-rich single-pass membrane protein 2 isoform X1 n=1 Tax=Patagioenas fasciata TaxID=372321 RepID=UPI0032E92EB3
MPREAGEDSMGRAESAVAAEPGDPDGGEPGAISLHPVESISDLHWASGGHKGAEDNSPALSSSLRQPPPRPALLSPPVLLPTLRPVPPAGPCPCLGPGHPLLLALLGLLALASLVLATLAIYLSGTWHWARWGRGGLGAVGGPSRLSPACPHPVPAVLQSQSVRALAQWLRSQEEAVRQLRAASGQLWARLNTSMEPGGHR